MTDKLLLKKINKSAGQSQKLGFFKSIVLLILILIVLLLIANIIMGVYYDI